MNVASVSEAQKRIAEAKSSLGMGERKQLFESVEAEGIRQRVAQSKIDLANSKIDQTQFNQQVLALIFQLEKCTKLT
jgi:hypothetical protein